MIYPILEVRYKGGLQAEVGVKFNPGVSPGPDESFYKVWCESVKVRISVIGRYRGGLHASGGAKFKTVRDDASLETFDHFETSLGGLRNLPILEFTQGYSLGDLADFGSSL